MKKTAILFVHYGEPWLRGSEICLLNLLDQLGPEYQALLWTNNPRLQQAATKLGVNTTRDDFSILLGWQAPRFDILSFYRQLRKTRALLKAHQIKLVHVNSGAPNQWVLPACFLSNIPLIVQLHCDYLLRDRATLLLHFAPRIVTVSKAIATQLLAEGYPEKQLRVIYNGVPHPSAQRYFSVRARLNIASDAPVLISVGSLIARKGFSRLIDAVEGLHQRGYHAHLVVIGEGPARQALEQKVAALRLTHHVHLVGEQTNVSDWLASNVNLFVSGAHQEAFGLVLVEAALAKLAVVAPNVDGIGEVVQHQVSGLLYESGNPQHLLTCLITLLKDKALARKMGEQGYQRANDHFSIRDNTLAFEALYQQQLGLPCVACAPFYVQCIAFIRALTRPLSTLWRTGLSQLAISVLSVRKRKQQESL